MPTISPATRALRARREELTDQLLSRLHSSTALHYREPDVEQLAERCSRLVLAFLKSMEEEPTRLAQYLRVIAAERIDEGVTLPELQLVLHILETSCWQICDEEIRSREQLVPALARVSGVIGHAKDALAQVYLEAARNTRRDLHDLRDRFEELARGTDSGLLAE